MGLLACCCLLCDELHCWILIGQPVARGGSEQAHLNQAVPLTGQAFTILGGAMGGYVRRALGGVCAAVTPEHCRGLLERPVGNRDTGG